MRIEVLCSGADASESHLAISQAFEAANRYLAPRRLRAYQAQIAETRELIICDPRDGTPTVCTGSLYHLPKSFSYEFLGPSGRFWILTGPISRGYPLAAVFYPDDMLCLFDPSFVDASYLAGLLARLPKPNMDEDLREPHPEPRLVLGHQNYAHFAWNEFSGLLEWQASYQSRHIDIIAIAEPILSLEGLIMNLQDISITHRCEADLLSSPRGRYLFYAFGSEHVTLATQQRITEQCAAQRPILINPDAPPTFYLWISLRKLYRHALNEIEAFTGIIAALFAKNPNLRILLDGYSLPFDLLVDRRYNIAAERAKQQEVATAARILVKGLEPALANRVHNLCEVDLAASIAAAQLADFYICHHGTQQHKIGWLYSVPGIVHANRLILETLPSGWVQSQSEESTLPEYIPADMVTECNSPNNPRQHMPYFADYSFADLSALQSFVVDRVSSAYTEWLTRRPRT